MDYLYKWGAMGAAKPRPVFTELWQRYQMHVVWHGFCSLEGQWFWGVVKTHQLRFVFFLTTINCKCNYKKPVLRKIWQILWTPKYQLPDRLWKSILSESVTWNKLVHLYHLFHYVPMKVSNQNFFKNLGYNGLNPPLVFFFSPNTLKWN